MNLFTPTKLTIVTVTGAGIIGGSVGLAKHMQTTLPPAISIKAQIEGENKKLLTGDRPELWGIKLSTYEKEIRAKHPTITIANAGELKIWCETKTSIDFKDSDQAEYKVAKEICTVPTNREKFLSIPKTLTKGDGWTQKLTSYKQEGTGVNAIPKIDKNTVNDAQVIKQWCEKEIEKEFKTENNDYNLALKWCTETK
ncbi:hypothetical protein [Candidatus Mycoplasma haematobovis]|nr:hypothetical protein [Candidatus Mycoplasma haematobovis]